MIWRTLFFLIGWLLSAAAWAHGDEVHDAAPPALGQAVAPRADAHSELFELLIIAEGEQLRLYLDDFASNAPVSGARIEVERGSGWQAQAREHALGEYLLKAPWLRQPGPHPLSFTIEAGERADLLAITLSLPAAATPTASAVAPAPAAGVVAAALGLALAAGWAWRRQQKPTPSKAAP